MDQIASKDDRNTRDRMTKEILKAVETQSVIDSKGRDALYVGTNEDEDKKKLAARPANPPLLRTPGGAGKSRARERVRGRGEGECAELYN